MKLDNNIQAFFELVRTGLWEKEARLAQYGDFDFSRILKIATEQSVVGLVAVGLEHTVDVKVPQDDLLSFVGQALIIEQRNKAMNAFVSELIGRLSRADIYAILVKGQGIAQCYERPLWRTCGDVDLLLSEDNYKKAKALLIPLADSVEQEFVFLKHLGMRISGWEVELHGSQRPRLSKRIDRNVDEVQRDVFYDGKVRSWMNGNTSVFLPAPDEDVIFVFTHILHHYYQEGIGLRQICDWCRLLWTFRSSIDVALLDERLRKMGLISEWKSFAAYAVDYLGMPMETMPLYSSAKKWVKKAKRINEYVMEVGYFGHNRSQKKMESFVLRKAVSLWRRTKDCLRHFLVFPKNSPRIWWYMVRTGFLVVRGE